MQRVENTARQVRKEEVFFFMRFDWCYTIVLFFGHYTLIFSETA